MWSLEDREANWCRIKVAKQQSCRGQEQSVEGSVLPVATLLPGGCRHLTKPHYYRCLVRIASSLKLRKHSCVGLSKVSALALHLATQRIPGASEGRACASGVWHPAAAAVGEPGSPQSPPAFWGGAGALVPAIVRTNIHEC